MITVIDSGVANLASVMAALQRLHADAEITVGHAKIRTASHVILPGVGAAPAAMKGLHEKGLVEVIRGLTQPVLGICLGMQVLFDGSEEGQTDGNTLQCLGVLPGIVSQLKASPDHPVPHMGWNTLKLVKSANPLLRGIKEGAYVYFVHSFAVPVGDDVTVASTDYGSTFTAIANQRNFYGCQFHPERSSTVGQRILQNFLGITA